MFHQPEGSNEASFTPASFGASAPGCGCDSACAFGFSGGGAGHPEAADDAAGEVFAFSTDDCANAPNARNVASVARCTSSAWIADCNMFRLSLSHCSTARISLMRLSSSSTFVSGASMSDIMDSDGDPPGAAAAANGFSFIMSHIFSIMSPWGKPVMPGKLPKGDVSPGVSVMRLSP